MDTELFTTLPVRTILLDNLRDCLRERGDELERYTNDMLAALAGEPLETREIAQISDFLLKLHADLDECSSTLSTQLGEPNAASVMLV